MGYYLADVIYPSWATFVKTIPEPRGNKKKYFAKAQESCRKDVERDSGFYKLALLSFEDQFVSGMRKR
jgi:hypothetical protein